MATIAGEVVYWSDFNGAFLFCTTIAVSTATTAFTGHGCGRQTNHQPQHGKTNQFIYHYAKIESFLGNASHLLWIDPKVLFNKEMPDS